MTASEKSQNRQKQTKFTFVLIALMIAGLFLFAFIHIPLEGLREAVVGTIWGLLGHEGANKFSTPRDT